MPKRSEIPLEERNYGHLYLLLAGLLALSTFWAIWDMIRARAPWQRYQMELNVQEYAKVQEKLAAEEQEFDQAYSEQYPSLLAQLEEARAKLEGEAYQTTIAELALADERVQDAMQEYRFAKSEYDALWYLYKHAEHEGDEGEMQKLRPEVESLTAAVAALKQKWDAAEVARNEVETRLDAQRARVDSLQTAIITLRKPITEIRDRLERIADRKIKIEQFVLADFVRGNFESFLDQVDRCTSCHVNADKGGYDDYDLPFKTHPKRDPLFKIHPINRFGCTPCHEGQGQALRLPYAHGKVAYWEHPMLDKSLLEAGCNKCHKNEMKVEHAPNLTRAKHMLFDLGCYGCHDIAGFEKARKIGPPLNAITRKTTPAFIYRWVKNTTAFRQHTRMPNPEFTDEEAIAVAAYLNDISKSSDYQAPKAPRGGSAERGEKLVESIGCKGCHVVTEEDREVRVTDVSYDIAPELTRIGSKVSRDWLYAWIKNPKQYYPSTSMPRLRLTDDEALDIVAYLMARKESNTPANNISDASLNSPELIAEGKRIIRNFGCHGCHDIKGMETEGKVSVSLNEFGGKTHDELFFGDALARGEVKAETWDEWTLGKMRNSRLYATEVVVQRMPNFAFGKEDARTMAMLLKSWDGRVIGKRYLHDTGRLGEAIEKGRRLVRQYNCIGCHIIEGEGGFIRPTIVEAFKKQGRSEDEALSFSPPDLIAEGRKVQPDWLFNFLKNPASKIRPWLSVRMPTFDFTDEEVNVLIEYFQALDGLSEPFQEIDIELTVTEMRAAEELFSPDLLSCFSCHQVGDKKPEGPPSGWAPDFLLAPDRLNPDWVFDWIADPQSLQPGTRMPSFYPDAAPPDILDGNPDKQVEALRDYLMSIRRFANKL
ncbi:MAG: c-type cytochrome [bacterium]